GILIFTLLPMGTSMAFFDSMNANLFSEMKGVVTLNGKPVSEAVIVRTATPDSGKEYTDSTQTDAQGRFHFARMEAFMPSRLLPSEKTVSQEVVIEHGGKKYLAWKAATNDVDKGELNKRSAIGTDKEIDINLSCELSAPETKKRGAYTTVITGICSWEGQQLLN
ncbi:DUF6795 domain-containing protein, partial [Pseudomonadota bacterium]